MKTTRKIGWQKYEDLIEQQIKSPLSGLLLGAMIPRLEEIEADGDDEVLLDQNEPFIVAIPETLSGEIQLTTNFDCWIAHTNFDITEKIKNTINKIEGVEALKVYSRYRFFIGVGKMFDFKEVRKEIENRLIQEKKNEQI
jgi:hypothetical protein